MLRIRGTLDNKNLQLFVQLNSWRVECKVCNGSIHSYFKVTFAGSFVFRAEERRVDFNVYKLYSQHLTVDSFQRCLVASDDSSHWSANLLLIRSQLRLSPTKMSSNRTARLPLVPNQLDHQWPPRPSPSGSTYWVSTVVRAPWSHVAAQTSRETGNLLSETMETSFFTASRRECELIIVKSYFCGLKMTPMEPLWCTRSLL